MADVIFWPGSGSTPVNKTPLGLYDEDDLFVEEAPRIANWITQRLGYPVMQVEMTERQLYAIIEEAVTEYSSQVNEFNLRENMMVLQGSATASTVTQKLIQGSPLPYVVELSSQYGMEAQVGGKVDLKTGYIDTVSGQQEYDLSSLWAAVSESGNRIEIRRVFHERIPAISRGGFGFGDTGGDTTGVGPNTGTNNLLGEFGWAGYDGGLNAIGGSAGMFLMMPTYETLLRDQAIEFNDMIRRSQYSFELVNNKLKVMPRPTGERVYFQYYVTQDKFATAVQMSGSVVSDYSNAPYTNMVYTNINDVGKQWIRKFALALAKETLGRILSKYESMPIPNSEVRLDGPILRQEASADKDVLFTQLRETLTEAGRQKQMEKMKENEQNMQELMKKVPLLIYIG